MSKVFGDVSPAPAVLCRDMPVGVVDDLSVLALWRRGFDTARMAGVFKVPESEVANRLARLRDMGAR